MTRDEIVDFLEWAQDCGQLQFPESRKVDMAEMYIKEQEAVNKTCNIPHVSHCACTPDETTGTTSVNCCNICGKPAEDFWRCG